MHAKINGQSDNGIRAKNSTGSNGNGNLIEILKSKAKYRLILKTVFVAGNATFQGISETIGISRTTVEVAVRDLIKASALETSLGENNIKTVRVPSERKGEIQQALEKTKAIDESENEGVSMSFLQDSFNQNFSKGLSMSEDQIEKFCNKLSALKNTVGLTVSQSSLLRALEGVRISNNLNAYDSRRRRYQ